MNTDHTPQKQTQRKTTVVWEDKPPENLLMEDNNLALPPNNAFVDKITIECMMNKKHYKTYLAKTNPAKLKETVELQKNIRLNRGNIADIFDHLLEDSTKTIRGRKTRYNYDIQNSFNQFIHHTVKYLELNCENKTASGMEDAEYEDEDIRRDYGEIYNSFDTNEIFHPNEFTDSDITIIKRTHTKEKPPKRPHTSNI